MELQIDRQRIERRIEKLAEFIDPSKPAYTRRAFTPVYSEARRWLSGEFEQAGLNTHIDAGGNLIGRKDGTDQEAPSIMLGSHIDTVAEGGRFDGTAGVIAALEVAQTLAENRRYLQHPLEVVDFLSEEVSDYGASCVGSRAMAGTLMPDMLTGSNDTETLADAITRMGGNPELAVSGSRQPANIAAFLELHIEQGPVLERAGVPVGVVEGIAGIRRYEVEVAGRADHSGTTPMDLRQDALYAATEVIRRVFLLASGAAGNSGLVATTGRIENFPNVANVVPGRVRLIVEARSVNSKEIDSFFERLFAELELAYAQSGVSLSHRFISDAPPTACDPELRAAIRSAATNRGLRFLDMPSGAGHDAMQIAHICPVGMIFVPSLAGRSHTPEEFTKVEDIAAGTSVLLDAVTHLDAQTRRG